MYRRKLRKKIRRRKNLLNFLLLFLSPTNTLMIKLSSDLDKLVLTYQKNLYKRYLKRQVFVKCSRLSA